jgi:2-haloacid dehalogenase
MLMRTLVFDVNETLLDLAALRPHFQALFGDESVLQAWFGELLRGSLVATVTGRYHPFGEIGRAALRLTGVRHGVELTESQIDAVLGTMTRLQPHPDVKPALGRLRAAGFRLATLTNSPYSILERQLANAGLTPYFDVTLSVDDVQLFKPHPAVYRMAARRLEAAPGDLRLIAAHNWDVTGALRAGLRAAFVARPGMALGPLDEMPDIIEPDLLAVAARILEIDRPD